MADLNKYYDVNEHKSYAALPPGKVTVGKLPDGTYIIKLGNEYIRVSANDPRVTGRPKMASETLKEKAPSLHTGIDKYLGANESEAVDNKLNEMGNFWWTHPQLYIRPSYWDSNIHLAVHDGNNIAALTISTPFLVYGGVLAFPYIKTGLEIAGQALTPSTWLEGLAGAGGYTVPEWLSLGTDLAASSYLAYLAGKDLDEKGLTWDTGLNALLSLAPFTRDKRAVDAVANTFSFGKYKPNGLITSSPRVKLVPGVEVDNAATADNMLTNTDDIAYSITTLPSSSYTSVSSTTSPNWLAKPVKRADGNYELVDGTIIPEEKVNSPILERYLGTPIISNGKRRVFDHNGVYTLSYDDRGFFLAKLPWEDRPVQFSTSKDAAYYLLNGRKAYIDDILIPGMEDYIKNRRLVHPLMEKEELGDNPDRLSPTYSDFLKGTLKKTAYDFYLSPQYIDRFTKVFGGDKGSVGKSIANDLDAILANTNIIEYSMPSLNRGISLLYRSLPGLPYKGYIGLNTNSYNLNNISSWTSTLFHELGHNIRRNNTPFSSSILHYSNDILRDNPIEYSVDLSKLSKGDLDFVHYISNPDEFRQRIIEGVKFMWEHNLTPELVVSNPTSIGGFEDLKKYIKKDYLIKMLGMMLATSPLIMKNNDNET